MMKKRLISFVTLLFCIGSMSAINAQSLFDFAPETDEGDIPLQWSSGVDFTYDDYKKESDSRVGWSDFTIGGGAGFGYSDDDGSGSTSFCLSAEFLAKVMGEDRNPNGAGYLGAYANYHNGSSDFIDDSILEAGIKFSYFDRISTFNNTQLIYGANAFYETGSREFSGFEDDITGYGARAYAGVNFRINNKVSIGVEAPIATYRSRTFKSNGSEFKTDGFSFAINKDNPVMASVRVNLVNAFKFGGKNTDGDGIEDLDDVCPETPGLSEFNGCPDTDGDGIEDSKDDCPNKPGLLKNNGCPDS